jgi:hypothetical protein
MDAMDELVRRVTVVSGSGDHRSAEVAYRSDDDKDRDEFFEDLERPRSRRAERRMRHMLKADLIAAQDAYRRHLASVRKGGEEWIYDAPGNFLRSTRKAYREARKASPFGLLGMMMPFNDYYADEED